MLVRPSLTFKITRFCHSTNLINECLNSCCLITVACRRYWVAIDLKILYSPQFGKLWPQVQWLSRRSCPNDHHGARLRLRGVIYTPATAWGGNLMMQVIINDSSYPVQLSISPTGPVFQSDRPGRYASRTVAVRPYAHIEFGTMCT
jgi:hypothetical protein